MKGTKKVRLAANGWRIGSPAEFLGLSNEEAALVEMKLALARCRPTLRPRRVGEQPAD